MNGLPLLSHPPPDSGSDASSCRRCNKEFNFLFTRQKRCNHCGYAYCSSCADFQAMMPRTGADRGYDALSVCSFCMDMLTITASSKPRLRSLPLSTLRSYMKAYNIRTTGAALEKDDLVEAILRAKGSNGCLLPAHEDYYRKHSVPLKSNERSRPRSIFSRTSRQEPPAPTPQPQHRQYPPPPGPPPPQARATPPRHQYQQQYHPEAPSPQTPSSQQRPPRHNPAFTPQSPRSYSTRPQAPSSNLRSSASQTNFHSPTPGAYPTGNEFHARQPPPRPRSAAPTVPPRPPAPPAPPPPVPSLDSLLQMTPDDIAHFSISTLKSILFENRVNTSFGVLEKQDLVQKVIALVDDEKRDRRIKEQEEREDREEAERMEWARREREKAEDERKATERDRKLMEERLRDHGGLRPDEEAGGTTTDSTNDYTNGPDNSHQDASSRSPPLYQFSDRTHDGVCVVCQDEHANMAIIDCGHLALCKGCSETVMKTTRECPLCRTRIVTEQRLLRIFKS